MPLMTLSDFANATTAQALVNEIALQAYDPAGLLGNPYIGYAGSMNGVGSNTLSTPKVGILSDVEMSDVAEGASVADSQFTITDADLSLGRIAASIGQTDISRIVQRYGGLNVENLAAALARIYGFKVTQKLCALGSGFSNQAGSTGVDMTVDDLLTAIIAIELNGFADPPYGCMIHPRQFADLRESIRGEAGAVKDLEQSREMMAAKPAGFRGSFLGCDIYSLSRVPLVNASADRSGMLIAPGAVHMTDGVAEPVGAAQAYTAGPLTVEFEREGRAGVSRIIVSAHVGVGELEDSLGCEIATDA